MVTGLGFFSRLVFFCDIFVGRVVRAIDPDPFGCHGGVTGFDDAYDDGLVIDFGVFFLLFVHDDRLGVVTETDVFCLLHAETDFCILSGFLAQPVVFCEVQLEIDFDIFLHQHAYCCCLGWRHSGFFHHHLSLPVLLVLMVGSDVLSDGLG